METRVTATRPRFAWTLLALLLSSAALLSSLLMAPGAMATPTLGLEVEHFPAVKEGNFLFAAPAGEITRSDQGFIYKLKLKNTSPSVATCQPNTWTATPAASFTYQWFRDGVALAGATASTYTPVAGDSGHSLQCRVTGTNSAGASSQMSAPNFLGSSTAGAPTPVSMTTNWRPTVAGTTERTCTAPTGWNFGPTWSFQWLRSGVPIPAATATAKTETGKNTLTEVTTASGSGELTSGSKNVTGVVTATGAFKIGQTITAPAGIPAGTTIKAVGAGTLELSVAATATGAQPLTAGARPFTVGEAISGAGIPAGTTITAVSGQTVTLSASATASASGVAVTATATTAKYLPLSAAGEEDANKVLQCMAVGTNAVGAVAAISNNVNVGTVTGAPVNVQFQAGTVRNPLTQGAEWVSGATNIAVVLPEGVVLTTTPAESWACALAAQRCTISQAVAPGGEFPVLSLTTALFPSAPDVVTLVAFASGGGASEERAEHSFTLAPAVPFAVVGFKTAAVDESGVEGAQQLAGSHPYAASAKLEFPKRNSIAVEDVHEIWTDLPVGFVGNPQSIEVQCSATDFQAGTCPAASAAGGVRLQFNVAQDLEDLANPEGGQAVFRLKPEKGYPAAFGFQIAKVKFVFRVKIRSESDYGITVIAPKTPQLNFSGPLSGARFTFCEYGSKTETSIFNPDALFKGCRRASDPAASSQPLLTVGTKCAGSVPRTEIVADSWQHPGANLPDGRPDLSDPTWAVSHFDSSPVGACQPLTEAWVGKDGPTLTIQPDNTEADTPAGYTAHLHIPQDGLTDPGGLATSHLKDTIVRLATGPSLNPSVGDGISVCSEAQIGLISKSPIHFNSVLPHCPDGSKLGNARVETPLLENPLRGSIYLAAQKENPFDSDYAIYLAIEEPDAGITVKLAGRVVADPDTGQLTTTFTENPQLPFEDLVLEFFGGGRASLANPSTCGTFTTKTELTPWSAVDPDNPQPDEIATPTDPISVTTGPGGSTCSNSPAARPFRLAMDAGSANAKAGATSPFSMRITRPDGSQELEELTVKTPPGYSAYLRGIPACSQAQVQAAKSKSGLAERENSSCPAASRLGYINSGAGAGPTPLFTPGNVYLGGPYKGEPLSLVTITPALAGGSAAKPAFDLGNVVVQVAIHVDRQNASITAKSDPIPRILKGIPLRIRDIRVNLDRPDWGLNPTSCDPSATTVDARGSEGAISTVSTRFQVGGCDKLAFGPKFSAKLTGPTKRGDHPAFTATVNFPAGQANTKDVQVTLPHSEFLDQAHINTICTRVQAAAHQCPAGSIYGFAEAETPLLDGKLTGPVFLKSSDHQLPDLAIALRGPDNQPVEVEFAGRIDSIKGQIRNTIEGLPDVPVTKFVLRMKGARKGLLVNSRDLCKGKPTRMTVHMVGQNNKVADSRPPLGNDCGGKKHRKGRGDRKKNRTASRLIAVW